MALSTLEKRVLEFLETNKGKDFPAKVISKTLKIEKGTVNSILYGKLTKTGNVTHDNQTPPLWKFLEEEPEKEPEEDPDTEDEDDPEPINMIFVDLGNIHDILQKLENYAGNDDCEVYAFADPGFNGYGINPAPKNAEIHVYKTNDEHKNAADIEMVWKAAEIVMSRDENEIRRGIRFIIFTKDKGFCSLKAILKRYAGVKEVLFVQTWEEAREFIE
jgi:hypothetical protein